MPCLFLACPRHSTSRFTSCHTVVLRWWSRQESEKCRKRSSKYFRRNARSASRRGQLRALQTRRLSRYKQSGSKTKTRPHPQKRRVRHPASVGDVKRRKTHPFPPAAGRRKRRERVGHPGIFCDRVRHPGITSGWPAICPRSGLSLSLSRFSLPSLRATRPQSNTL